MAKQQTTPQQKPSAGNGNGTALATVDPAALAALADVEIIDDGLSEMDQSDVKLPTKTLNMKGVDKHGEEIPKTVWYDTVDEVGKKVLRVVFVSVYKTNVYSKYDSTEGRNKIICRSDDLVTGRMKESGLERPCKGCPDTVWVKVTRDDGKVANVRNCAPVKNVIAYDRDEEKLVTLRFKKTAMPALDTHLNKHHLGKGKSAGLNRKDVPIFFFEVKLTAVLAAAGTHAVPVLERGALLTADEVRSMADGAAYVREHRATILQGADEAGERHEGAPDTSFDPDKLGGEQGKDFVDAPAA